MNYISLLIKFRRGDTRAIGFVAFITAEIQNDIKPPEMPVISHFLFWRTLNGLFAVELQVLDERKQGYIAAAREFGCFGLVEGSHFIQPAAVANKS